jgi:hypothetical protein
MAKRSNNFVAGALAVAVTSAALGIAGWPRASQACPFCTALGPTLCQLREQAAITALAEVQTQTASGRASLRLHRVLVGVERLKGIETLEVTLDAAARPGSLLLVFGTGSEKAAPAALAWHAVGVNETSYAYFARAPELKIATTQRLRYFAPFLENAEGLVAQDAYLEFGHATFDEVARVADALPLERMRSWLADPNVPPQRKGFYGLALGLARGDGARRDNADFLRQMIMTPEDDFRAGFDGILGGYLLLKGSAGLELIETRYLANPRAADGDVRHALVAIRFCHEYVSEIPIERLRSAVGHLLARPEFAAVAITDLARWQDWGALVRIGQLYTQKSYSDPAVRRAIIGYLLACPGRQASEELARLREIDPQGVATAEQILSRASSIPPGQQ